MTITILSITALALIILLAFALKKNAVYQTRVNTLQEQLSTVSGQVSALNEQLSRQQARLEEAQRQVSATKENEARLSERLQFLSAEKERIMQESETKLQFITEEKERIARESEERFKNLASEILKDNSRQFKEANETRLAEILNPLRENIEAFKKSVADAYNTEARERFSLQKSLRELVELNQTIGREAQDLTAALKGNSKVQGDWGEMILENILEKSGLRRGHEYDIQVTSDESGRTLRDEQGRGLRPDVVIYYPDKRCIVVDSKVSLTAYTNYVNAETEEQRAIYGKNHLQSIRSHIAELAHKKYQEYIGDGKTDFVMMFIPNEGAYIAALQLDPTLWCWPLRCPIP